MIKSLILWWVLCCIILWLWWNDVYAIACEDGNICSCSCQQSAGGSFCPGNCIVNNEWPSSTSSTSSNSSTSSSSFDTPPVVPVIPDWWTEQVGPRIWDGWLLNQETDILPNIPRTGQWLGTTGTIQVWERVMNTIKNVINRFLGLMALIALVLIIRAWFKILVWQDSDYEQAKTTLKNAFFGIVMIGISRLIVTFFFYIVCVFTVGEYCTS